VGVHLRSGIDEVKAEGLNARLRALAPYRTMARAPKLSTLRIHRCATLRILMQTTNASKANGRKIFSYVRTDLSILLTLFIYSPVRRGKIVKRCENQLKM